MRICDVINEAFDPESPEVKILKREIKELGWASFKARQRAHFEFSTTGLQKESPTESIPGEMVEFAFNTGLLLSDIDPQRMTVLSTLVLLSYLLGVKDGKEDDHAK
jgi:hypothetical protein